jgi:hypothetical protein
MNKKATESNTEDSREKAQKPQNGTPVLAPIVPFRGYRIDRFGPMQPACLGHCSEGGSRSVTVSNGDDLDRWKPLPGSGNPFLGLWRGLETSFSADSLILPHSPAFSRVSGEEGGWHRRPAGSSRPLAGWRDWLPLLRNRIRERRSPCAPDPIAEASGGTPAATGPEVRTDKTCPARGAARSTHNFPSRFGAISTGFDLFRPVSAKKRKNQVWVAPAFRRFQPASGRMARLAAAGAEQDSRTAFSLCRGLYCKLPSSDKELRHIKPRWGDGDQPERPTAA